MTSDVFTKTKRSAVMARIRGTGNKDTELRLIALMRAHGITGWRRHRPLFGKPDFVFPKQKLAVFVDGCFWHGCPQHFTRPKSRQEFWDAKIAANQARDRLVTCTLRSRGWRVLRLWEHALRPSHAARTMAQLKRRVCGDKQDPRGRVAAPARRPTRVGWFISR